MANNSREFVYLYKYRPVLADNRYALFQKREWLFRSGCRPEYMLDHFVRACRVKFGVNERDVFFQRWSRQKWPRRFGGSGPFRKKGVGIDEPNVKNDHSKIGIERGKRPLLMAATRLQYPVNTFSLSPSFSPEVQDSRHWTPYRSEPCFSDQKLKLRLEMRKIQFNDAIVLGSSQENSSASGGSM